MLKREIKLYCFIATVYLCSLDGVSGCERLQVFEYIENRLFLFFFEQMFVAKLYLKMK